MLSVRQLLNNDLETGEIACDLNAPVSSENYLDDADKNIKANKKHSTSKQAPQQGLEGRKSASALSATARGPFSPTRSLDVLATTQICEK